MSVNSNVKLRNGTSDNSGLGAMSIIKAIIPGKKDTNINGVSALCASLNVLHLLAIAMHKPLIKNENAIITIAANIKLIVEGIKLLSLYISNMLFDMASDTTVRIRLSMPVITEDRVMLKYFPIIISLLLIGKVSNVSSVPLSFSPAVASVAGYIAEIAIAIIINKKE